MRTHWAPNIASSWRHRSTVWQVNFYLILRGKWRHLAINLEVFRLSEICLSEMLQLRSDSYIFGGGGAVIHIQLKVTEMLCFCRLFLFPFSCEDKTVKKYLFPMWVERALREWFSLCKGWRVAVRLLGCYVVTCCMISLYLTMSKKGWGVEGWAACSMADLQQGFTSHPLNVSGEKKGAGGEDSPWMCMLHMLTCSSKQGTACTCCSSVKLCPIPWKPKKSLRSEITSLKLSAAAYVLWYSQNSHPLRQIFNFYKTFLLKWGPSVHTSYLFLLPAKMKVWQSFACIPFMQWQPASPSCSSISQKDTSGRLLQMLQTLRKMFINPSSLF